VTYKIQLDDEIRNATPEETAALDAERAAAAQAQTEAEAKAATRAAALAKLGLNAEEIAALFG